MTKRTKADLEAENELLYEKLEFVQDEIDEVLNPCDRDEQLNDDEDVNDENAEDV